MRYSEIIGEGFHNIGLSPEKLELIDKHFLAAAHHRALYLQERGGAFHWDRYIAHLRALFALVFSGDFSSAVDPSRRGFERREAWNPTKLESVELSMAAIDQLLPDPEMFDYMPKDDRWRLERAHPHDRLLWSN